jgi:hypothetical protein
VHVFSWMVGIRGLIDPFRIESLLNFQCVQQKQWRSAVERTCFLASFRALHFLHRVRFGGLPNAVRPDLESEHSDSPDEDDVGSRLAKRQHHRDKADVSHGCTDSDSPEADSLAEESRQPKRAHRPSVAREASTETMNGHTSAAATNDNNTRWAPSLANRASGLSRVCVCVCVWKDC